MHQHRAENAGYARRGRNAADGAGVVIAELEEAEAATRKVI